jgi:hypothetical protein
MRKIEQQMLKAIRTKDNWSKDNTRVVYGQGLDITRIYLHNHLIATYWHGDITPLVVDVETLRQWPTMTTRSRLRALGADLVSKRGVLYLNGKAI